MVGSSIVEAPPVFEEFALVGAALLIRLVEHHRCARVAHARFAIFVITTSALSVSFRDATRATFHLRNPARDTRLRPLRS